MGNSILLKFDVANQVIRHLNSSVLESICTFLLENEVFIFFFLYLFIPILHYFYYIIIQESIPDRFNAPGPALAKESFGPDAQILINSDVARLR